MSVGQYPLLLFFSHPESPLGAPFWQWLQKKEKKGFVAGILNARLSVGVAAHDGFHDCNILAN